MYAGMLTGLEAGYATASTDTGHASSPEGPGGRFTLGHPQKLIDYAYRADHELTVDAKAIIKAFYGRVPAHSYWIGCSLGGLEGLIEAKRYPADYDGIVAGAPPNPLVRFNALQLWPDWLISQDQTRLIPKEKYSMVHEAVLKACATPVGRKEGLIEEPAKCGFDPGQLQCKGADEATCLTASQVYLLRQTYSGPVNPRTKELIFPGPARGSELEMFNFASGEAGNIALDLFRYAAFQNPDWNWKALDWDKDVTAAIEKIGPLLHVDADLKAFFAHGGKLLLYIGWNDYHNPEQLIDYYQTLMRNSGQRASGSVRLFTIPGMNHCQGGAGCDTFDKLGVIDAWVDKGQTPQRIVASRFDNGKLVRTRPLCAWPEVARYKGTGDTEDAAQFDCTAE
jgi:feruloyl esterase